MPRVEHRNIREHLSYAFFPNKADGIDSPFFFMNLNKIVYKLVVTIFEPKYSKKLFYIKKQKPDSFPKTISIT